MSHKTVIGCDVSKAWIDVAQNDGTNVRDRRVANAQKEINQWAERLPKRCVIGMEATGTMHELLARTLVELGHTVYVINPRWIHGYARNVGLRGKTDRSDARLIARYVSAEAKHLHPYRPPTAEHAELQYLLKRRIELAKLRAATQMSLGEQAKAVVKEFNAVMKEMERKIRRLLAANSERKARAARLMQVPGVGPLVAAHLVNALERTPFRGSDAFVAHTGTDPRPNDSGQKRGRRRLTHHGDASLRGMLFMAALAACKKPEWKAIYDHHQQKGLASTEVLNIIARKIARITFSIFKNGSAYDPAHVTSPQTRCLAS